MSEKPAPPENRKPQNYTPIKRLAQWLFELSNPPPRKVTHVITNQRRTSSGTMLTTSHTLQPDGSGKLVVNHADPLTGQEKTHEFEIGWQKKLEGKKRKQSKIRQ